MTYNRAEEGGAFVSGNENHIYIAIDLKSFYASVECQERDLDPLTTNLYLCKVAMDIVCLLYTSDAADD